MDISVLERIGPCEWRAPRRGAMRVPGVLYADQDLVRDMDDKVLEQLCNVAALPGIVRAAYAMPDAHWGYGFPIGGVAAFDPEDGGVISAGGVGFDISCGVRTMATGLARTAVEPHKERLAELLFQRIPAGMGRVGRIHLTPAQLDGVLTKGAVWAIDNGYGLAEDAETIEEGGCVPDARPEFVSDKAKIRQRDEMGTLGSGNHYLELQEVVEIFRPSVAETFGLRAGDVVVTIHSGSRGLGHQVGTDYLGEMAHTAGRFGIVLPDRELACAPIESEIGWRYLGAMRAATNCALANREILGHLARQTFAQIFPEARLRLIFDVSHNTCKVEEHRLDGRPRTLFVHRKGATRAFGPGHPDLPERYRAVGQPVLIGGSMGTESYVLCGLPEAEDKAFASACHGAGRALSRHAALRQWQGRAVVDALAERGILIRSSSLRGVAEEAPGAYKNVRAVVDAAETAGLAGKVARLAPFVCVKG
ncbi:MAG: RtcB family protein [Magnetospirillum sp.]|nr:RtcB family protein [Magnetospirillum sp.]